MNKETGKPIIRKNQMKVMSEHMRDKANHHLVIYARQRFPMQFEQTDDDTLYKFVEKVRSTANKYKIQKENDVATFLDFTVMYGEDFHKDPWASDFLKCDTLHGPDKMAMLRDRVQKSGVNL
jgi:hypothetical protein